MLAKWGKRYPLVFLVVLMLALNGGNYVLSSSAVHQAVASAASTQQLCELGNEARTQQITLWTHLIVISAPPPHESAAARAKREQATREFTAYLRQVFAPRDCGKVGNTP